MLYSLLGCVSECVVTDLFACEGKVTRAQSHSRCFFSTTVWDFGTSAVHIIEHRAEGGQGSTGRDGGTGNDGLALLSNNSFVL